MPFAGRKSLFHLRAKFMVRCTSIVICGVIKKTGRRTAATPKKNNHSFDKRERMNRYLKCCELHSLFYTGLTTMVATNWFPSGQYMTTRTKFLTAFIDYFRERRCVRLL